MAMSPRKTMAMMKSGGAVKKMRGGGMVKKMRGGGMMKKMKAGGAVKKMRAGGMAKKMRGGGMVKKLSKGGSASKPKKGKFPDLTGDGKVTKKDVLVGRGVLKRNKGGSVDNDKPLTVKELMKILKDVPPSKMSEKFLRKPDLKGVPKMSEQYKKGFLRKP